MSHTLKVEPWGPSIANARIHFNYDLSGHVCMTWDDASQLCGPSFRAEVPGAFFLALLDSPYNPARGEGKPVPRPLPQGCSLPSLPDAPSPRAPSNHAEIPEARVLDCWRYPAVEEPRVYLREDGHLTAECGTARLCVGRLELGRWRFVESEHALRGVLLIYREGSVLSHSPVPLEKRNGSSQVEAGSPATARVTAEVSSTGEFPTPRRYELDGDGVAEVAPLDAVKAAELAAVDAELVKQGLGPRPKKFVKPPRLTEGEIFMRVGKDALAKRCARLIVKNAGSASYWRKSGSTCKELRHHVANLHGPEVDEQAFKEAGGRRSTGSKGGARQLELSWEELENYVRLLPQEETAQDRQLGGDR